ncbi:MAG: hypothetical protein COB65_01205 [Thalassobium sp.]|nr:MAG: hypothetical protein COB65_01205 [Thalassobium sp.]
MFGAYAENNVYLPKVLREFEFELVESEQLRDSTASSYYYLLTQASIHNNIDIQTGFVHSTLTVELMAEIVNCINTQRDLVGSTEEDNKLSQCMQVLVNKIEDPHMSVASIASEIGAILSEKDFNKAIYRNIALLVLYHVGDEYRMMNYTTRMADSSNTDVYITLSEAGDITIDEEAVILEDVLGNVRDKVRGRVDLMQVYLSVDPSVKMGPVNALKTELADAGVKSILYSTTGNRRDPLKIDLDWE